jgi:hypothetical protein
VVLYGYQAATANVDDTAVPEPGALPQLITGAMFLTGAARRRTQ